MTVFKTAPLALVAIAVSTAAARAEEPIALDRVVISGGLTPVDAESYARASTIITGEELERRQVATVADALRRVPGVHVSRTGGLGGATSVRIRGAESNHTLVLIDGVEAADSATGFEFADLTADQIERIEVLRGPQSALYGAGATAGVINIITRGGVRDGARITLTAEAGSAPSRAASALAQAGDERGEIALGLSWRDDEGWDSSGSGGEKDGAETLTLNAKAVIDAADWLRLRGSARVTDRDSEFDGTAFGCGSSACYVVDSPVGRTKGRDFFASLAADMDLGPMAVFTPRLSYSENENDVTAAPGPSSNAASTFKADPRLTLFFGSQDRHALTGAVEYKRETFRSSFAGNDEKERKSHGVALDYQGQITDALFVQAGARYDDNDAFDDAVSWAASASHAFDFGTTLRGSIGQGQTNPTFFEQFGFIPGSFTGNPNLTPEKNFSWDLGVSQTLLDGRATVSATYFNETLTDEIAGFGATVNNLNGDSERQGVELALSAEPLPGLTVSASYAYLDATEPGGAPETRRPRHSGGLDIAYAFLEDRASLGATLTVFGDHHQRDFGDPSFASPLVDHDGYTTVDIQGRYRATDSIEVFGTVKNLFDEDYEEVRGYAAQPLTAALGVRATW